MGLKISLPPSLYEEAMEVGRLRHEHAMKHELRDRMTYSIQGSLERHQNGARAEASVFHVTGLEWKKFCTRDFKRGRSRSLCDVGPIEVRHKFANKPCDLLVNKDDWPMSPYLLVHELDKMTYALVGWCFGFEAQQDKYWAGWMPNPAFVVPHRLLYGLMSLSDYCRVIDQPWKKTVLTSTG